jgi:hypothetical protein
MLGFYIATGLAFVLLAGGWLAWTLTRTRICGSWRNSDECYDLVFRPNGTFERRWFNVDASNTSRNYGRWEQQDSELQVTIEKRTVDPRFQSARLRPLPYTLKMKVQSISPKVLVVSIEGRPSQTLKRVREGQGPGE